MTSSETMPAATACGRRENAGSNMHISMSRPAFTARAPASARSRAKCWVTIERTALASETTKPSKPNAPRSTSVSSQRLPDAGTPFRSMYAPMMLAAPASTAARNGGRWTFQSSESEISASS